MIYAIGDIHGSYSKLKELYSKILSDINSYDDKTGTIVFLGDFVDRGTHTREVLDFLMGLKDSENIKHIFVKGNHEDMMYDFYYNNLSKEMYLANGGVQTLDSFECATSKDFCLNENIKPYIDWIGSLPPIHIIERYAFVHAGYDTRKSFDEQNPVVLLWKRVSPYSEYCEYVDCEYMVIHGHTPHKLPRIHMNEINVDTNACYEGDLTAVCLPCLLDEYSIEEIKSMDAVKFNSIVKEKLYFIVV